MPHALPGDSVPHVPQEDRPTSGAGEPIPCHERKWKKRPARLHTAVICMYGRAQARGVIGASCCEPRTRGKESVVHTVSVLRALALRYELQ